MLVGVVCATGNQGSSVVQALAAKGHAVRALVQNTSAPEAQNIKLKHNELVELVEATLEDVASLTKAFEGVDAVYACTPDGEGDILQGKSIADAALKANTKLLIWSTGLDIEAITGGKIVGVGMLERKVRVEEYIKELGLNYVFIRIGDYFENIINYRLISYDKSSDQITLATAGSIPNAPVESAYIRQDLGRAVELILSNPTHFQTGENPSVYFPTEKEKDYVHFGSEELSFQGIADIVAKKSGKKVNLIANPACNEELGALFRYFDEFGGWGKHHPPIPDPKLTSVGFKATPYEDFVIDDVLPFLGL